MSGDPSQDYFSNGITEVLTSDLSRISSLFVIAPNTLSEFRLSLLAKFLTFAIARTGNCDPLVASLRVFRFAPRLGGEDPVDKSQEGGRVRLVTVQSGR